MLESRILPYLRHFRLDKLKPTDIMKFYDMLEKDTQIRRIKHNNGYRTLRPLSQKTILEHHRLIRAMLHKAVYWQLLYSNPCERVQPPKTRKPKRRYYDDEQCKTLISGLNELSADEIKYKGIFTKEPKTESSIRDVAIPDFVVSLLDEYKDWYKEQKSVYGELWTNSNRLFVQSGGKPMHPSTISKWFVRFVKEIGLPVINFHGLRHTNATLLISQNIDIAVVAARLGHAQISTTFNFYVYPIISHNKNAGNVLETLLIPNET